MVMSSAQIAGMNGSFQQQSMMNMQHAGMLSQNAGQPSQGMAQGMVGGGINTAAALAGPLASGAMMLGGVDPLSMGLKGAMSGFGRAGMMGAMGGGLAAAALPMAGLMGAQYVGGQMMQGMQDNQMVRGQLNQGFSHVNQYGGRGFTGSESHNIANHMRDMSGSRGPGGEFATMDELGRLASNMGRMGMAQGVKDAKDFKDKFTKMMKTVKTVAEEFSTSLEEAQKIMSSMRGAGVFGNNNQAAMAKSMRSGAVGAGVSMEEMSQMANIGSQISRSIGGRGRAGALAGTRAMESVGGAVEAGVLTEEDIYNQTGLTGAAGKQAMATSMLQRDASFLKKGRGRQLLAAIATKDGGVDQEAIQKIMMGETTVGETIQMRKGHLNTMSRANFIRNEGKLRGEAMAGFGGMAETASHMGWLRGKGYDPASGDDKAMLALQKHTGMDRDEAENQMRIMRNMDSIVDKMSDNRQSSETASAVGRRNKSIGIEGAKRKLEDMKKGVNDTLQQAGADIMQGAEDRLESFINTITGEYKRRIVEGTAEGVRHTRTGSGGSRADSLTGFKRALNINRDRMEDVYGASISYEGSDKGVAAGDMKFTSDGQRAGNLGEYVLGKKHQTGGMGSRLAGGWADQMSMTANMAMVGGPGMAMAASGGGIDLAGFFGIGELSESERKAGGALLETKQGLAQSRQIMEASSPEGAAAASKAAQERLKVMEEEDGNAGEIAMQKGITAAARVKAGESKERVAKELGIPVDEISRAENAMGASLDAEALSRARQAGEELMSGIRDDLGGDEMIAFEQEYGGERATMGHKGPVYDREGNQLKGMEAMDAVQRGEGFTSNDGGLSTKAGKLAMEHKRLSEVDTSVMNKTAKIDHDKKMIGLNVQMDKLFEERRAGMEDMSDEELEAEIANGGLDAGMARKERHQDKVMGRARKSRKKGASLQAATQLFGGELSSEAAADMYGKSGKELMASYSAHTGLDTSTMKDDDLVKLTDMLEKAAKGQDIDKELTGVEGSGFREGLKDARNKAQDAGAQQTDPSYRKLDSMDTHMGNMVKMLGTLNEETKGMAKNLGEKGEGVGGKDK